MENFILTTYLSRPTGGRENFREENSILKLFSKLFQIEQIKLYLRVKIALTLIPNLKYSLKKKFCIRAISHLSSSTMNSSPFFACSFEALYLVRLLIKTWYFHPNIESNQKIFYLTRYKSFKSQYATFFFNNKYFDRFRATVIVTL